MTSVKADIIEAHIFRQKGRKIEYLLLKRAENEIYPGLWQMVSGRLKVNEIAHSAALREIKEETGCTPFKMWVAPTVNSFYYPVDDTITMIPVFLAQVNHSDVVKLSEEHTEYMWVSKHEAQKLLAWRGQRKAVEICEEYLVDGISFLNFVEINLLNKG